MATFLLSTVPSFFLILSVVLALESISVEYSQDVEAGTVVTTGKSNAAAYLRASIPVGDNDVFSEEKDLMQIIRDNYPWKIQQNSETATPLTTNNKHDYQQVQDDHPEEECRVYVAESSIPNAGLGVYTGVDLSSFDPIGNPQIGILTFDDTQALSLLDNYHWSSDNCYMGQFEADAVQCLHPGPGMLVNSHPSLVNARVMHFPHTEQQHRGHMRRTIDQGAGAVSEYYGLETCATVSIEKGSEIFVSYGTDWFAHRAEYANLPTKSNYNKADQIISDFLSQDSYSVSPQEAWNKILHETGEIDRQTRGALPDKVAELESASDIGTARYFLPNFVRSIDWLKLNGQCMDNLIFGKSTIPQAGQGAFATRFIGKGELIAPAPLVHLDENVLTRQITTVEGKDLDRKQLIFNYCFSHPKSSLLLFPSSSTVQFINHSSKKANAKIQWSTSDLHQEDWLSEPLEDVKSRTKSGLMFDIVATRDIVLGEEVLLDYGNDWAAAWEEHLQREMPRGHDFGSASILNNDPSLVVIKTLMEEWDDPYPIDAQTVCIFDYRNDGSDDNDGSGVGGVNNDNVQHKIMKWELPLTWGNTGAKLYRPCDILSRKRFGNHDFYIARIHNYFHVEHEIPDSLVLIVTMIPRWAIRFTDNKYSSNQHHTSAFRQPIGIPDGLLPPHWLDL